MRISAWLKTTTVTAAALIGSQLLGVSAPIQAQITGQPTGVGFPQPGAMPANGGVSGGGASPGAVGGNIGLAAANLSSYILGAGDQISLSVIGYPEFTGTTAVLPDGTVTLPLVGPVRAAGLTPNQLTAAMPAPMRA